MTTMVFARRRIIIPMMRLSSLLAGDDDLVAVSDSRFVRGALWWGKYGRRSPPGSPPMSDEEVDDMIRRCRMLRQLPRERGVKMIAEAWARWTDVLEKESIDRVVSLPIDSYILHVLLLVCRKRGIPFVAVTWTPFSNRLRFTLFGETMAKTASADLDELVEGVFQRFRTESVRPDWLFGVDTAPSRVALRRLIFDMVKPIAFFAYRLLSGDRDSFLYSNRKLRQRLMVATPERYRAAVRVERNASKSLPDEYAFMPLQFYPEATSDYWIREAQVHNHHEAVLAVARTLGRIMPVVVKEHPAAFGRRSASFLRELAAVPNVQFVPLGADTNQISREAVFIIGQGSTTTFQAQVMGKQVLFFGTPYFHVCSGSQVLNDLSPAAIEAAVQRILAFDGEASDDEIRGMVHEFVASTGAGSMGDYSPLFERPSKKGSPAFVGKDLQAMFDALTVPPRQRPDTPASSPAAAAGAE